MEDGRERSDDIARIEEKLRSYAIWTRNPELCQTLLTRVLPLWQADLDLEVDTQDGSRRRKNTWTKVRDHFPKEINEAEPIIRFIVDFVHEWDDNGVPITIIDLCSGFGISSMALAEILPPERVGRIWMVDKLWPHDPTNPSEGNLSTKHLSGRSYPIPLKYRKTDIKAGRELRQIHKYVLEAAPGPVILMGIHLCKSLAVRAIQLCQSSQKIVAFCLKPCCLPGRKMAFKPKIPIVWEFKNGYSFGPRDLYREEQQCEEKDGSAVQERYQSHDHDHDDDDDNHDLGGTVIVPTFGGVENGHDETNPKKKYLSEEDGDEDDKEARGHAAVSEEEHQCDGDENEGAKGEGYDGQNGKKRRDTRLRCGGNSPEKQKTAASAVGHSDPNFTNERFSQW
eukprot:CAMPEP_0194031728 /NCGR_PEP_ID=MMETSP0009_2-20130614/4830_1 /TAXON_ID=210454 /ORGANISM="Grammatophora oceanica, Strain CCMP 410" /LENGTH=394 /DNA_ID=CAMNT_0038671957 /DNA_START=35 /DNA_END=1216 /DNA_ORIENTATION=-